MFESIKLNIKYWVANLFFGDIMFNREMSQEIDRLLIKVESLQEKNNESEERNNALEERNNALEEEKLMRAGWLD